MPNQLGQDIGYPGYTPDLTSLALQKRAAAIQQGQIQPVGAATMTDPQDAPGAYASDYTPSPKPSASPDMSSSGNDSAASASLKKRREKLSTDDTPAPPKETFSSIE